MDQEREEAIERVVLNRAEVKRQLEAAIATTKMLENRLTNLTRQFNELMGGAPVEPARCVETAMDDFVNSDGYQEFIGH